MIKSAQKGVVSPLVIGGVVVLGIVVFLVTSGTLKFPGSIKVDDQNVGKIETQNAQSTPKEEPKPEVKLNPEPFTDSKLGFSISYPEDWKVRSDTKGVSLYLPSSAGSEKADVLVIVNTAPLGELRGSKLSTVADLQKVYLKKQFSNMVVIKEREIKVVDTDAYEIEFTAIIKGENMRARYIMLTTTADLYGILASANEGMWNKYTGSLDAVISSFKLQ